MFLHVLMTKKKKCPSKALSNSDVMMCMCVITGSSACVFCNQLFLPALLFPERNINKCPVLFKQLSLTSLSPSPALNSGYKYNGNVGKSPSGDVYRILSCDSPPPGPTSGHRESFIICRGFVQEMCIKTTDAGTKVKQPLNPPTHAGKRHNTDPTQKCVRARVCVCVY